VTTGAHFILRAAPSPSRANCVKAIWSALNDWVVTIKPPTRSNVQNAKMHVVLGQLVKANAKYCGQRMDVEDWKDVLGAAVMASQRGELRIVPGMDGGVVILGCHTSDMTSKEMSEVIERAYCIGTQNDPPVRFVEDVEPTGR